MRQNPYRMGFRFWAAMGSPATAHSSGGCWLQRAPALREPTDYAAVWNGFATGSLWCPVCPKGYSAVGFLFASATEKPNLNESRCVLSNLTDPEPPDVGEVIWSQGNLQVFKLKPRNEGTQATTLCPGTFGATGTSTPLPAQPACLRNAYINCTRRSPMPNLEQVKAIVQAYAPLVYLHPEDPSRPSSVNWFFENGAMLYKKGQESRPVRIEANLPQLGSDAGLYWIDVPGNRKEDLIRGDLESAGAYVHAKQMDGGAFTELAAWMFYPFNGALLVRIPVLKKAYPLGEVGAHLSDFEHATLRVGNWDGMLESVFLSQHGGGRWVVASELEYPRGDEGSNRVAAYSARNSHALYPAPMDDVLKPEFKGFGVVTAAKRDDRYVVDAAVKFTVVAADYANAAAAVEQPPWLNFCGKWGPQETDLKKALEKERKRLPFFLRKVFDAFVGIIPRQLLEESSPVGPKPRPTWDGPEKTD